MWVHYFAHLKARALRLPRWYLGVTFGEQVITARGRRTIGAMTKVSRRGQQFDADGRGSDVVIVARSEDGLVPRRLLGAILPLRGAHEQKNGSLGSISKDVTNFTQIQDLESPTN
jgi:hypothetical protein